MKRVTVIVLSFLLGFGLVVSVKVLATILQIITGGTVTVA